jgi:hypothetical protein
MRIAGKPAVTMQLGHRVLLISLGAFLAVVSVLLAFGIVQ